MEDNEKISGTPSDETPQQPHKLLEMQEDDSEKKGLSEYARKEIREWVVSIAVALIAVFLIRTFLFTVIRVEGPSMLDTLHEGDRMIVTIIDMKLNGAQRGDVVICHYPERKDQFVKRVVGVAGDVVEIRGGVTYINGAAQAEPYVTHPPRDDYGPYTVPEDHYFVMGDNRGNSNDSRYSDVGALQEDMLVGIARLIIWPFADVGAVTKVS